MLESDKAHIERLNNYIIELEASRRDLWGVNEELREKIGALERGQEDQQLMINGLHENNAVLRKELNHANTHWKQCQSELQQEKYDHKLTQESKASNDKDYLEVCVQRNQAWRELKTIRTLIDADLEESTEDEIHRLVSHKTKLEVIVQNYVSVLGELKPLT